MNGHPTIENLRRAAQALTSEAEKLTRAAQALEGMTVEPGVYVVELARMLRQHGLCVIERGALSLALEAMDAHSHTELDGDSPLTACDYRKAIDAVREAVRGTYPALQGPTSA